MATKRCSYCYQRGHTRPTCPEIKKEIHNNPNGYYARRARIKAERKKARGPSVRKCSYCKETGHNKKTCTTLKFDRVEMRVKNKKFAKAFVEGCKTFGLYPGALLELRSSEELKEQGVNNYRISQLEREKKRVGSLAMVTGFSEYVLSHDLCDDNKYLRSEACISVRFPSGRKSFLPLPHEFRHIAHNSEGCTHGFWKMGCPVDASKVLNFFSDEWKSGDRSVDRQLGLD